MDKQEVEEGIVYLVGAGPGDPELLTLRAQALIKGCDVLVYDHLANRRLHDWASTDCLLIDVGKSPGRHTVEQTEIGKILVEKATEGLKVVRLKGGDPFVFGRCAEEMLALDEAQISYEIVPGVTAALACAAYAGIPLSHREYGSSICFLTGHEDVAKESLRVDFAKFSEVGGTLCIYMGMSKLEEIVEKLLSGGLDQDRPAAIVSQGTLPSQRKIVAPLGKLVEQARGGNLGAPAIIFVGNSIGLARPSTWFDKAPLFGRRIVLTRNRCQQSKIRASLERLGAEVMDLPLIEIQPSEDRKLIAEVFAGIATYEWVVFTSANGARYFMEFFFRAYKDIRSFGPMRIACVGESTAEVFKKYKLDVELIAKDSTAEGLAKELVATDSLDSANVLVVTGNRNRDILVGLLETVGRAIVDTLPVYQTDFADILEAPDIEKFKTVGADAMIFTSSSTALSYVEQAEDIVFEKDAKKPVFCSFGPQTSKTLQENNMEVTLEATHPSIDGLTEALIDYFNDSHEA
jgi:uroporphyrinogen III methyltransferase/synthase